MYPITQEGYRLFTAPYRQIVRISFYGLGEELHLTEQDIRAKGFTLNRYCVSGNKIEIGSVVAGELKLVLDNKDGRFDDVTFEGAEMYVQVGTKKWDAHRWENAEVHYVPLGYFTVNEAPRKLDSISFAALDRMVLFDKPVDWSLIEFPIGISDLLEHICDMCNVGLGINANLLPNADYLVNSAPTAENLTYRQILSWIAEVTGTCAFIDWNGQLILKWYSNTDTVIDSNIRYKSDIKENAITITGVRVKSGEDVYQFGNDGYVINIENNQLIQHRQYDVCGTIAAQLVGFTYTPYSATVKPMPHLYPLDKITFVKDDVDIPTIITNVTYVLNGSTSLMGKGETAVNNSYAAANPLTAREAAIIENIKQVQNNTLNDRVQSILAFNELICNSLGLFETPIRQDDGSVLYYLHDKNNLDESQTIFTMTANGIAWTTQGWNGGHPTWSYGVTSAGDAFFKLISAEGIEVSKVGSDYNIEITPSRFSIYYRDLPVTEIEADEMTIPKVFFTGYAQCGKVRLIPYKDEGTNLVFLD